ncbi:MAG: undecaprenyldiphospho-muramoylpentapeptide beta-N-acetylglucosaminyltransferase [Limnobacter sp.]|nr:undecaprenyldiphospho-muramoylpentapeptide beta-N-acetylglucosaminyltransferase [Limnobacter sp.]
MKDNRLALIVAGGTGGHIFPGLSVAESLMSDGWTIRWAGNPEAMEGRLVPQHGIALCPLVFSGFRGKGLVSQLLMPLKLLKAFWVSIRILRAQKPSVVLGMGGYVAFPMGMMASLLNIPLVVHEQNSIAGLTNKVLAKLADRVLVAFPGALANATWVGNPVRQTMTVQLPPAERFKERSGALRLLVVGGSLGAAALNEVVPKAMARLPEHKRPLIRHQSGQKNLDQLQLNYECAGVQADCVAFIEDMALEMAQADVLICRAGAMTVSEVASVGVAALFVPFPFAVDDHQTTNAGFLVKVKGAWVKQQSELNDQELSQWFEQLTRDLCLQYAINAHSMAKQDAATVVAQTMKDVSGTS